MGLEKSLVPVPVRMSGVEIDHGAHNNFELISIGMSFVYEKASLRGVRNGNKLHECRSCTHREGLPYCQSRENSGAEPMQPC